MAASGEVELAFNQSAYTAAACGTISGASVKATVDGAVAADETVTVTLAGGYTFADGSTTYTGVTDSAGNLALPDISVPALGGTATFTATSGTATTTATATAPANAGGAYLAENANPTYGSRTSVPADAVAVGGEYFLTPGGDLWYYNTKIATGVTSADGYLHPSNGRYYASYNTVADC